MMDPTIRIPNWETFQHYKDRSPPWIKLHRQLLNNRNWHKLSGDAGKLLVDLWLVAAESEDGTIASGTDDLAWRLRRPVDQMAALLVELERGDFLDLSVHDASVLIAGCLHGASTEGEAEREAEVQQRDIKTTPTAGEFSKKVEYEHTNSSLALEAHQVLGMGQWGDELSAKYRETKKIIRTHWEASGISLDRVHAAIHGLRILVDRGDVPWLADLKQKPLRGLEVLVGTQAVLPGPDGGQLRSLFDAATDAYQDDQLNPRRKANSGPVKLSVSVNPGFVA